MITMYICVTISLMNNCSLSGKFDLRTVTGSEDVETTHHHVTFQELQSMFCSFGFVSSEDDFCCNDVFNADHANGD